MQEIEEGNYVPDEVSPPGETLVEVLSARGMSQAQLAERTGRPKKTINEIIKNRAMITSETAVQFERVLGVPASFWTAREAHYRAHLAKLQEAKELEKFTSWPNEFPISEMRSRGWITKASSGVSLVRELLGFFGLAAPTSFDPVYSLNTSHFRKSDKHPVDTHALAAWLRRGELEGTRQTCAAYDRQTFVAVLDRVRALTIKNPEASANELKELCSSAGVAVVFLAELPKIRTNGVTRWLTPDRALIQLSLRYKRADILWFTFFHEAAHLLLHGKKEVFLELLELEKTEKEAEADRFASDALIPPKKLEQFLVAKDYSATAISLFAKAIGVHSGIVLGRLQHDHVVPHSAHAELFMRIDPERLGSLAK